MKVVLFIVRCLVGLLFIFSGLIKANDPLGLSYKMQEFFEAWSMPAFFHELTLPMAVVMNAFEIIAGVALIVGWRIQMFIRLLLLLIVFFTFLTAYATYATNADGSLKFRSCGCFGDCLPLDPKQSFWKDIILLVLSVILFLFRSRIQPLFTAATTNAALVLLSGVLAFAVQWYVLRYLPFVDCLPYKKGNALLPLRQLPPDAIPDEFDIRFVYSKNGLQQEFPMTGLPDSTWTFVDRKQVLVKKGKNNEPKIKDFILSDSSGNDVTESILQTGDNYFLLFLLNVKEIDEHTPWVQKIAQLKLTQNIQIVTAVPVEVIALSGKIPALRGINVLSCDGTAIKTAARTIPTLFKMEKDKVIQKWSGASSERWQ